MSVSPSSAPSSSESSLTLMWATLFLERREGGGEGGREGGRGGREEGREGGMKYKKTKEVLCASENLLKLQQ